MANAKNKKSAKLPPTNWKAFVRPDLAEWEAKDPYAIASTQIKKLSEAAKSGHYSTPIDYGTYIISIFGLFFCAVEMVVSLYRDVLREWSDDRWMIILFGFSIAWWALNWKRLRDF